VPYFPLFINLSEQPCVVVGGGAVAERKARSLLDFGPRLTVIAPEPAEGLRCLAGEGRIRLWERPYGGPEDLAGAALVIAATDRGGVNEAVSRDARRAGIPVNVADNPGLCTFFFPALVRRGELVGGISSSGACPRVSARLREWLEGLWPGNLGENLNFIKALRQRLRGEKRSPAEISAELDRFISRALSGEGLGPGEPSAGEPSGGKGREP
jgi:siroheme synthase-like protein